MISFISLHLFIEVSMIDTDSKEKSSHSDDKSKSCKSEIVEKLIGRKLIRIFYIVDAPDIEHDLDKTDNPKYRSMYSIDQYKEQNIHQRKVEHSSQYRKTWNKSKI